jgi:hypothetical protein
MMTVIRFYQVFSAHWCRSRTPTNTKVYYGSGGCPESDKARQPVPAANTDVIANSKFSPGNNQTRTLNTWHLFTDATGRVRGRQAALTLATCVCVHSDPLAV